MKSKKLIALVLTAVLTASMVPSIALAKTGTSSKSDSASFSTQAVKGKYANAYYYESTKTIVITKSDKFPYKNPSAKVELTPSTKLFNWTEKEQGKTNYIPKFPDATTVEFKGSITMPADCSYYFANMKKLKTIKGLKNMNTSKVTNMEGMFARTGFTTLDLKGLNTSKVTSMKNMFYLCKNLKSLNLSNLKNTVVKNMQNMFYSCNALETLNLTKFNTAAVTNMTNMFYNCNKLTSLDLSSFNTAKVTEMIAMFKYCESLTSLDLSSFNTAKVTDMKYMFQQCQNLESVNVSSFNTAKVQRMTGMFANCKSLKSFDAPKFNTKNCRFMGNLFLNCKSLESVNLAGWTAQKLNSVHSRMFKGCTNLTSLKVGTSFYFKRDMNIPGKSWLCPDGKTYETNNLIMNMAAGTYKRVS